MGDTHKIQSYRVALRRGLGIRKLTPTATLGEFVNEMDALGGVRLCHNAVFTIYAVKEEDGYNLYIMKRYHYFRRKK